MAGSDVLQTDGNIKLLNRLVRAAVALLLLGYSIFSQASPIGAIALLPLVAIYPMFTAVAGWDPLLFIIDAARGHERRLQLRLAVRFALAIAGAVMIAVTLTISGELGWYSLLALFAIIPVFIAILGEDPVEALCDSREQLRQAYRTRQPPAAAGNAVMDENADLQDGATSRRSPHNRRAA